MNILIIGAGGREHALGWKISQSEKVNNLFFAPGNAGTSNIGTNIAVAATDFGNLKQAVLENKVTLVVVGPEDPLVQGIHDYFESDPELTHVAVVGPRKVGAMLEGSKDFAKKFMLRHDIPTARYLTVSKQNTEEGIHFLKQLQPPYVLKADGLAAGKGVLIINSFDKAQESLKDMLAGKFGDASSKVVIEEFLQGIELSVFIITDGKNYKILPEAKDYKRIGEADTGLNTGGMGAISPVPFASNEFMEKVETRIIKPTIRGLTKDNIEYKGFIFFGLIMVDNDPYVIEYNVRLGDPETEAIMLRIKSDFTDLLTGAATGTLHEKVLELDDKPAATIMLVSGGYPETYEKGKEITGIDDVHGSVVFHAGTRHRGNDVITNGGRVIAISSIGNSIEEALKLSYDNAGSIRFENKYYRKDIGFDL